MNVNTKLTLAATDNILAELTALIQIMGIQGSVSKDRIKEAQKRLIEYQKIIQECNR